MGKASMCIQMLQILRSGRVYKCTELAELLETNPRNVIEYKKELEEAGYYIVSIPGKYGGYKLEQGSLIPSLNLSNEEKKYYKSVPTTFFRGEIFWMPKSFKWRFPVFFLLSSGCRFLRKLSLFPALPLP